MVMDTKDIAYFMAVYEEHSINRAAKKLFITSQGLSRVLKKLETEYSTEFFERTAQGVIATESGRRFYEHCLELERQMKLLRDDMESIGNERETFRIGYANGVLQYVPLSKFIEFSEKHDELDVSWSESANREVMESLKNGELDYGFVIGRPDDEEISEALIGQIPLIALVPEGNSLRANDTITLEDLQGQNIITMNEKFHIYHDLVGACRLHGITPEIAARTADLGTLLHLCMQGYGIAIAPDTNGYFPPQLKILRFEAAPTWDIYGVCLSSRKESVKTIEFEKLMNV